MFRYSAIVFILAFMPVAYNQFITFKDGKIGVNFFGYSAEAGLGGLLTGNAAHGGLSASAGTPFGQRAAAGIGGSLDEKGGQRGGGFAAATAGNGVGASAALGGNLNERGGHGGLGSEAHIPGYQSKSVLVSQHPQQLTIPQNVKPIEFGSLTPRASPQQNEISKLDSRIDNNNEDVVDDYQEPAAVPQQPVANQNLFDFGYFSDLAASISGAPDPRTQKGYAIQIRKQKTPHTVELQKIVIPEQGR